MVDFVNVNQGRRQKANNQNQTQNHEKIMNLLLVVTLLEQRSHPFYLLIKGIEKNKRETEKVDPIVSLLVIIELAESFPMVFRT